MYEPLLKVMAEKGLVQLVEDEKVDETQKVQFRELSACINSGAYLKITPKVRTVIWCLNANLVC